MDSLGVVRCIREELTEAELVLHECLQIRKKTMPASWQRYNTESILGGCLVGEKKYAEAESVLRSAYEGLKASEKTLPASLRVRLKDSILRLIRLYEAWGKKDEVRKWSTRFDDFVFPERPFAPP
jgi:eukaryotic-like serine/threonine-protein kinase